MTRMIRARDSRVVVVATMLLFATAARAQAQAPSDPGADSIGVHGRWTIEVSESDGTRVARHEFNNALASQRSLLLALSRQNTPGYWVVYIDDFYGGASPCGASTPCALQEPGHTSVFSGTTKFVVLSVSLEGSPVPDKLVLQGTFAATATGQISEVETQLSNCPNTSTPASPCSSSGNILTTHRMASTGPPPVGPIPVNAGQIIQVRVEITFSASTT
jgi:hypothetical protein